MDNEQLIDELRSHYSRDLRKQLVKTVLANEKSDDQSAAKPQYDLLDQIFSYVLKSSDWDIPDNLQGWNQSPLQIMGKVFPKLESTRWYREKRLAVSRNIDVVVEDKAKQ